MRALASVSIATKPSFGIPNVRRGQLARVNSPVPVPIHKNRETNIVQSRSILTA